MGEPDLVGNFGVKTVWSHKRDWGLAGTYIISSVGTLCLGETQAMISLESNMRFPKGCWSGRQNYRLLTSEEGDPFYMVLFCNLLCWGLCGWKLLKGAGSTLQNKWEYLPKKNTKWLSPACEHSTFWSRGTATYQAHPGPQQNLRGGSSGETLASTRLRPWGSLRCIPGLSVFRPADANECVEMWKHIDAWERLAYGIWMHMISYDYFIHFLLPPNRCTYWGSCHFWPGCAPETSRSFLQWKCVPQRFHGSPMGLPSVSHRSPWSAWCLLCARFLCRTSQWPWSYRAGHYPRWIDRSSARPVAFTGEAQGDRREQTRQGPTGPDRARQGREVRIDRSKRFQANIFCWTGICSLCS